LEQACLLERGDAAAEWKPAISTRVQLDTERAFRQLTREEEGGGRAGRTGSAAGQPWGSHLAPGW